MQEVARVTALFIYPIKSCGRIPLDVLQVDAMGPVGDRRWMIVDDTGLFLTQRKFSKMARIQPTLSASGLRVSIPELGDHEVPFAGIEQGMPAKVKVWSDDVDAFVCGGTVNAALSDFLERPVRLVYMSPSLPRRRQKSVDFTVGFADSRPFLLTNTASLADLSRRAGEVVPMDRFRPNIVVENTTPFSEDHWRTLRIGDVDFVDTSECVRCVMTTIDQTTGKKTGAEPLQTLRTFRAPEGSILFGQHLVHGGPGTLKVGDPVHA